jgi:hypothetical protein
MIYNNDNLGQQNSNPASRGVGLFFELYGANATASAMTAWTWGISRIIDALEMMSKAKINTKKIAVTGCSRDGKGALMAGAFESRIALTIPQESGSGGDTCAYLSTSFCRQANLFVQAGGCPSTSRTAVTSSSRRQRSSRRTCGSVQASITTSTASARCRTITTS